MVAEQDWDGPSDVHVGATGLTGEVVVGAHGAAWVGLIGPAAGAATVADSAVNTISPLLRDAFDAELDDEDTVFDRLWSGANTADERLRIRFSPVDPDGRAGLVLACIQHRAAFMVWTETGSAYLLRGDEVVNAVEGGRTLIDTAVDFDDLADLGHFEEEHDPPHAYLGGRPVDSSELVLHEVDPPWMLRHGDRLVLAPCSLSQHLKLDELAALLAGGPAEGAAHTLQTVLRVRSGADTPVVVIEIGGVDEAELQADDDTFEHLLEGLEDLLPAAFAEQLEALEQGIPPVDLGEDATDPFSPVRTIGTPVESAAPDLGDAKSADLHYTPPGGTRLRPSEPDLFGGGDTLVPRRPDSRQGEKAPLSSVEELDALLTGDEIGLPDEDSESVVETEEVERTPAPAPRASAPRAPSSAPTPESPSAKASSPTPSAVPTPSKSAGGASPLLWGGAGVIVLAVLAAAAGLFFTT